MVSIIMCLVLGHSELQTLDSKVHMLDLFDAAA
jgi:hypothetical protein